MALPMSNHKLMPPALLCPRINSKNWYSTFLNNICYVNRHKYFPPIRTSRFGRNKKSCRGIFLAASTTSLVVDAQQESTACPNKTRFEK